MRNCKGKLFAVLFCAALAFALISGCESGSSKAKKYQLVAMELTQKLDDKETEYQNDLEKQKKNYEKIIDRQKRELQQCQKARNTLERISSEGMDNYMKNIVGPMTKENQELKKKVQQLQGKIEELEEQQDN